MIHEEFILIDFMFSRKITMICLLRKFLNYFLFFILKIIFISMKDDYDFRL